MSALARLRTTRPPRTTGSLSSVPLRAVTFDCAGTLLHVDWHPARFALACAAEAGIPLPEDAPKAYERAFRACIPEFHAANAARDPQLGDLFYRNVSRDWLADLGQSDKLSALMQAAEDLAYGPSSIVFREYPDVPPALEDLQNRGIAIAVISNWDFTLHRALDRYRIAPFLKFALASLEEGVEKPDPALFEIALARLGLKPQEVLHVGDDPIDDQQGAANAGIRSVLIDRAQPPDPPHRISSLAKLPEVMEWTG